MFIEKEKAASLAAHGSVKEGEEAFGDLMAYRAVGRYR
jgi:hypothetical protein